MAEEPVTKRDLKEVRDELRADMQAMEERLVEVVRDSQTEILKAFMRIRKVTTSA